MSAGVLSEGLHALYTPKPDQDSRVEGLQSGIEGSRLMIQYR